MGKNQFVQRKRSIKRFLALFELLGIRRHNKSVQHKRAIDHFLALPDELKVYILRLTLPNQQRFIVPQVQPIRKRCGYYCSEDCYLGPVCALPEMAKLIYEVIYSRNIVFVFGPLKLRNRAYPPRSINEFFRHFHYDLVLAVKNLDYLHRLGNDDMGVTGERRQA